MYHEGEPPPGGGDDRLCIRILLLLLAAGCHTPTKLDSSVDTGPCDETWYEDEDADGYGYGDLQEGCRPATGAADTDGDCDDGEPAVHPGVAEHCDGRDEDCDGETDEDAPDVVTRYADADGDGYGDPESPETACEPPGTTLEEATDCDDTDPGIFVGAEEHCDGIDEDCDGAVDEDAVDTTAWYTDADGDGYGAGDPVYSCEGDAGATAVPGDCDDADATVMAATRETCNGLDDDCDGVIDGGYEVPALFPTIGEALAVAPAGALICVAAGTYMETLDFAGVDREVRGAGAGLTVIDGGGIGPVVTVTNGESAILADLTVTGGEAMSGAGVYAVGSTLTLEGVSITGNACDGDECLGAGIYVESSTMEARGLEVSANTIQCTDACKGVGMYADTSDVTVEDAIFADNTGIGRNVTLRGGAIYATGSRIEVTVSRAEIYGNTLAATGTSTADAQGAGFMAYSGTVATLTNVRLADNESSGGDHCGAATTLDRTVGAYLDNVILTGNVSDCPDAEGGAIGVGSYVTLVANNIDIRGHSSDRGGAVWVENRQAVISLTNAILSANDATEGGAIYLADADASATVGWSDFYDNGDTPFYQLTSPVGADGNVEVDPAYTDVSAALTRSWDLHLDAGSPLLDAGDPTVMDPDGSASDMGAYGGPRGGDW